MVHLKSEEISTSVAIGEGGRHLTCGTQNSPSQRPNDFAGKSVTLPAPDTGRTFGRPVSTESQLRTEH